MMVAPHMRAFSKAAPHSNPRLNRLAEEQSKLLRSIDNYLAAHPALASLGPDPLVRQLVSAKGFSNDDAVVVRALVGARIVTLIGVPTRIWRDPESKAELLEIKAEALGFGIRSILVPQRWIKAPVRAAVSRSIAMTRHVQYSTHQFATLLHHFKTSKLSTLAEAAHCVPEHDDPFGVVLLLCGQGVISIDRSRPISANTIVALRA